MSVQAKAAQKAKLQAIDANTTAIYLNGVTGNDANDGTTQATAVRTFAKAKELATTFQGINTIYITGTVPVSGETSLAGTNAILKREASFIGFLLNVGSGQTVTLSQITIDGNSEEATGADKSLVNCQGTLNISDGAVLQNNKLGSPLKRRMGGAVDCNGGTVNMTAGLIQNNSATLGGGLILRNGATFNMSGGTIQNNQTINGPDMAAMNDGAAGGGVCLYEGATFNLSGSALIRNNSSEEVGGGVSVGNLEASIQRSNRFFMTGGTIDGNTSRATGGGIFIQAAFRNLESMASITAGKITNNRMLGTGATNFMFGGGGIYVNGYESEFFRNGRLELTNVLITDNTAAIAGGGYAACPISDTKIFLTDGGAIYQNQAPLGKDIYLYSATIGMGAHGGNPEYYISDTMLGGVPYHWKYSDGTEVPLNDLKGVVTGEGISFDMYSDAIGNETTANLAKVIITGNYSATRGGGIGSNGDVIIGKEDETIEIDVRKNWEDTGNNQGLRPVIVEVELWRKISGSSDEPEYIGYETIIPDADGNWNLTFTLLPARDISWNSYEYSLIERTVPGYTTVVTGDAAAGFDVTNSIKPDIPEKPEIPELPDTGFPVGRRTVIASQPLNRYYSSSDMTLKLPTLNVELPIVGIPEKDSRWDVTWLKDQAGYLSGSAYPTWAGNTVLTAHVWTADDQSGPFIGIRNMKYGDPFTIDAFGKTYTYEVHQNQLIDASDINEVMQHQEKDWVTLLTCEDYNQSADSYNFRRIVRGLLVKIH
jgi:LPXTG-site transpeptidase (sortase) family protein